MKRLFPLLLLAVLLSGCALQEASPPVATLVPDTDTVMPAAEAPEALTDTFEAVLYFRYGTEPYLAAETRTLSRLPSEAPELTLIQALLEGPGTRSDALSATFPDGVKVISTARQGTTLFVTLSR